MRLAHIKLNGRLGLGIQVNDSLRGLMEDQAGYPGSLDTILAAGEEAFRNVQRALESAAELPMEGLNFLPPLCSPNKIICLGLNYVDHAIEGGMETPAYPTLFARYNSGLVGHNQPLVLPKISSKFDFEGELVAVIGRRGKNISKLRALEHVIGYSIFNDGSIRDYQLKTTQWTAGKNFDGTGAFGPLLVTADELPPGAKGLILETRLNGKSMQKASTSDMIFDVATTVALLSEFMTLEQGDVLVMGTPAGIGAVRKPPVFMQPGDVCEVEIEGLGLLRNGVVAE
jgi:acylpyruvate hydrolase